MSLTVTNFEMKYFLKKSLLEMNPILYLCVTTVGTNCCHIDLKRVLCFGCLFYFISYTDHIWDKMVSILDEHFVIAICYVSSLIEMAFEMNYCHLYLGQNILIGIYLFSSLIEMRTISFNIHCDMNNCTCFIILYAQML